MINIIPVTPYTMESVIPLAEMHANEFNEPFSGDQLKWYYQQKMFYSPADHYDSLIYQDKDLIGYASGFADVEGHRDIKLFNLQYVYILPDHRAGKVLLRLTDHLCYWLNEKAVRRVYISALRETNALDGIAELISRKMNFKISESKQIVLD